MSAYLIGSRWHLPSNDWKKTICGKALPHDAKQRFVYNVPKSRWCKTCLGVVGIIVLLGEGHMELKAKESAT